MAFNLTPIEGETHVIDTQQYKWNNLKQAWKFDITETQIETEILDRITQTTNSNLVYNQAIFPTDSAPDNEFGYRVKASDTHFATSAIVSENTFMGKVYVYNTEGSNEVIINNPTPDLLDYAEFGWDIALNSTYIAISDTYNNHNNASQNGDFQGVVYLFTLDGTLVHTFYPSNFAPNMYYGWSIDMSETHIVIGATEHGGAHSTIGATYVYDLATYTETIVPVPASVLAFDQFGRRVRISDTKIFVGSDYFENPLANAGSLFTFDLDGTNPLEIYPADSQNYDGFAGSFDYNDSIIVVGAPSEDTVINGAGKVYVFDHAGNELFSLLPPIVDDYLNYGSSVRVTSTQIIVGAIAYNGYVGTLWIYNLDGTNERQITNPDAELRYIGSDFSVAVTENDLYIGFDTYDGQAIANSGSIFHFKNGSFTESPLALEAITVAQTYTDNAIATTEIYTDDAINTLKNTEIATNTSDILANKIDLDTKIIDINYRLLQDYATFSGELKIEPSDQVALAEFGRSIAINDTKIVIGKPYDDTISGDDNGAIYIYDINGTNEIKVTPSDASINGWFGLNVAMNSTKIAVAQLLSENVYVYNLDGTGELIIPAPPRILTNDASTKLLMTETHIYMGDKNGDGISSNNGCVHRWNLDGTGLITVHSGVGFNNEQFGIDIFIHEDNIGILANDPYNGDIPRIYFYDLNFGNKRTVEFTNIDRPYSLAFNNTHILININGINPALCNLDGTNIRLITTDSPTLHGSNIYLDNDIMIIGHSSSDLNTLNDSGHVSLYTANGYNETIISASDIAAGDNFGGVLNVFNNKVAASSQSGTGASVYLFDYLIGEDAPFATSIISELPTQTIGTTLERPLTLIGSYHFDTDLNKPIWFNSTNWTDSTGTIV